jgi:transcriptional regulator with XRE-family HTH domain
MLVYQKVRAYLEEQGIKQKIVAEKIGMSVATFNAIMTGNRTMYADDLRAICYALNVAPETFIDFEPEP